MKTSNRCRAKAKATGERCRRQAIAGGFTCRVHGSAAGHVRKAARQRLSELLKPALGALGEALESGNYSAMVRAATVILDRTGYGPHSTLGVSVVSPEDRERLFAAFRAAGITHTQAQAVADALDAMEDGE